MRWLRLGAETTREELESALGSEAPVGIDLAGAPAALGRRELLLLLSRRGGFAVARLRGILSTPLAEAALLCDEALWEEGARLREDVGTVFGESLADILARVRDLASRLGPNASPETAKEIGELKSRIDQLEALASASFGTRAASRPPVVDRKNPRKERTEPSARPARPTQPTPTERRK